MHFGFTSEQEMFRNTVRSFVEKECTPELMRELDMSGTFPQAITQKMADLDWYSAFSSEQSGGSNLGPMYLAIMAEELARFSPSIAAAYYITIWGVFNIDLYGSQEHKDHYLPLINAGKQNFSFSMSEPESGSDAASLRTSAVLEGGEWVINGEKIWCTQAGAPHNSIILCARTDPSAPKHNGISLIFVPADSPGLTLKRTTVMARRMLGTYEMHFDNVRVPQSAVLGEVNKGWDYIVAHLERERMCVSANAVGNAKQVLSEIVSYVKQRRQFGRPLADFQAIQFNLAELKVAIDCAELLVYKVASMLEQGLPCNVEASEAKLFCTETQLRVAHEGMRMLGANGLTEEFGMPRAYREAMGAVTGGGTSNIQRSIIGRGLLRTN